MPVTGEVFAHPVARGSTPPGGCQLNRSSNAVARDRLEGKPSPSAPAGEIELLARIRAGETRLFHELIRPYERGVYLAAYAVLQNAGDAEEVAQETMLKAFTHLSELRQETTFKAWLLRIAVNEAGMRRWKNHASLFEPLEEDPPETEGEYPRQLADWREVPSEALERKEVRRAVARALQTLPTIYRDVFVLRDMQQLGVAETAAALGISTAAVKTRLHRARLQMREELSAVFRRRWYERVLFRKGAKPW